MGSDMIGRGQIYFVDLSSTQGREQSGRRPVLVVSSDAINRQPPGHYRVVVGSSVENISRDYPTNVRVPAAESGLPKDTVFLCFQIRSLDPARFQQPAGRLLPARIDEVDRALRLSLEL